VEGALRRVGLPSGQRVLGHAEVLRELADVHAGDLTQGPDLDGCPQWYVGAMRADHDPAPGSR
jgi:hypothetical protein